MGSPFAMKRGRSAIHGVSLSLNDSSPQEVPAAASLKDRADKIGLLKKLSGKGILTAGTWRQRYCLLVKSRLYFFENEDSNGTEKSSGFINLEYFDSCSEASTRISRKAANVFVIGATDKGFFESHSGRHYFAAETLTDTKEWISAINATMNKIRPKEKRTSSHLREKSPHFTAFSKSKDKERDRDKDKERESVSGSGPSKMKDKLTDSDSQELNLTPQGTLPRSSGRLDSSVAKSRARGPTGRRLPRKPSTSPLYPHVHHSQNSSPGGPRKKTVTAIVEKNQNRNTRSDEENNTSNSNSTDDNDVDNDLGHNNNDEGVSEELTSITSTTIRGRATSLTALEKSPADEISGENDSLNKTCTPNNNNTSSSSSNNNTSSEKKCSRQNSKGRSGRSGGSGGGNSKMAGCEKSWRSSRSMEFDSFLTDTSFSRKLGMTYRYSSSSDDSLNLEDTSGPSSIPSAAGCYHGGSTSLGKKITDFDTNKAPMIPPRTPIFRGSTIRNSSVTPPPCVLRRMRRDFSASNTPRSSKDFDADMGLGMESFLPEISGGARRTSSGSSLSTLTAEPRGNGHPNNNSSHSSNSGHHGSGSNTMQNVPPFARHISFSSLQRAPKVHPQFNNDNLYQTINNGSLSRGSSSANASPLMTSHRHHSNGSNGGGSSRVAGHFVVGHGSHVHHSHSHSNSSSGSGGGANVDNGSGNSVGGGASRTSPLERNIQTLKKDLGAVVLETRQLDVDVSSLRQDVGSVQENIATVRGALDLTRERVGRLTSQVNGIERQIQSIIKEANLMREEAGKLLEDAEASKASHEHLQEEAENLVSFLRQMTCCSRHHFCSTSSFSGNGQNSTSSTAPKFCPQPMPRKSKTPERILDDPDPILDCDEKGHGQGHCHHHSDEIGTMGSMTDKKRGSIGVTFANLAIDMSQLEGNNCCSSSGCANSTAHNNMNLNLTEREREVKSGPGRHVAKNMTENRDLEVKGKDFKDSCSSNLNNDNQKSGSIDDNENENENDLDDNDNISEISLLAEI